ncbi:hypothetical protein K1719_034450 [Acacia pycnantha]|nr:hypothetical protein K1719_034450 [Acacia pycnantha]
MYWCWFVLYQIAALVPNHEGYASHCTLDFLPFPWQSWNWKTPRVVFLPTHDAVTGKILSTLKQLNGFLVEVMTIGTCGPSVAVAFVINAVIEKLNGYKIFSVTFDVHLHEVFLQKQRGETEDQDNLPRKKKPQQTRRRGKS